MKRNILLMITTVVLGVGLPVLVLGATQYPVEGVWKLPQDGTLIEIKVNDGMAEGTILRRPGDRTDEVDKYNSDPKLRQQSIIGLKVLSHLKFYKSGSWKGGTVYDPDSGSTYHAQARLKDPNTLYLRGYIGIPLFGRTATLSRVQ